MHVKFWERIKDAFKETKEETIILTKEPQPKPKKKNKEKIEVEVSGSFEYMMKPDPNREYSFYQDHIVFAYFSGTVSANILGSEVSVKTTYSLSMISEGTKAKAFEKFVEMPEEKREELIVKELNKRVADTLRYHYDQMKSEDMDKVFEEMSKKELTIVMKIDQDKIVK